MSQLRCLGPPCYDVDVNWASTPSGAETDNLRKLLCPTRLYDVPIWHGVRLASDRSTFMVKISDIHGEQRITVARHRMHCSCSLGQRPFACAHMFWLTNALALYYVHSQPELDTHDLNLVRLEETASQAAIDHTAIARPMVVSPHQVLHRLFDGAGAWMRTRLQNQRIWIALNPYPSAGNALTRDMFGRVLDLVLTALGDTSDSVDEKLIWNLHFEKTKRWMETAMETANQVPIDRLTTGLVGWEGELLQSLEFASACNCLSREAIRCVLMAYESTVNALLLFDSSRHAAIWSVLLNGDRQSYFALSVLDLLSRRAQSQPALLEQWRRIISMLVRMFSGSMLRGSTEAQYYALRVREMLS